MVKLNESPMRTAVRPIRPRESSTPHACDPQSTMLPNRFSLCCGALALATCWLITDSAQAQGLTMAGSQSRSGAGGSRSGQSTAGRSATGQTGGGQAGASANAGFIFQDSTRNNASTRGMGGFGGMRSFGGFGNMSRFGANAFGNSSSSSKPAVRTRLGNAIELPANISPQVSEARVARQVAASPARRIVNGYDVAVVDGVATLSGTAPDDRSRRMAELMLKLEPGVRSVDNQIVVVD